MSGKPLRVAVVTNVLPHYRAALYRRLFERPDLDLRVYCQRSIPGLNLELAHDQFGDRVTIVPAFTLSRERFGWQWLPWMALLRRFDVLFVTGNVRIASGVLLGGVARALGIPVVLWGQAHTANANPRTERIRLGWWRWFDHFLVYTDGEARRLREQSFASRHVVGMNNGLDQRRIDAEAAAWDEARLQRFREEQEIGDRTVVLSCARLDPKNDFGLWVSALPRVLARHPRLVWCVIGDGPERPALEARIQESHLESHVRWLGRMFDEGELAPWFLSSACLVHPGAIGLTLLHAFGYGLPVVTHGDPVAHMPEFDAFEAGSTGLTFRRGDAEDLAGAMDRALSDADGRARMSARARQIAREGYNVDVMSDRFAEIAWHAAGTRRAFPTDRSTMIGSPTS